MSEKPEPLTDELLARLLASATPDAYLDATPVGTADAAAYANRLLAEKGLRRPSVIKDACIDAVHGYLVFKGTRGMSRDTAIKLAFGLRCTLGETQRLLRHAGVAELWCKLRRDAIIIFCIEHGYSLPACDDELYRLGEDTLVRGG